MTKPLQEESLETLKELLSLMNDVKSTKVTINENGINKTYTITQLRTLINQKEGNEDVD